MTNAQYTVAAPAYSGFACVDRENLAEARKRMAYLLRHVRMVIASGEKFHLMKVGEGHYSVVGRPSTPYTPGCGRLDDYSGEYFIVKNK